MSEIIFNSFKTLFKLLFFFYLYLCCVLFPVDFVQRTIRGETLQTGFGHKSCSIEIIYIKQIGLIDRFAVFGLRWKHCYTNLSRVDTAARRNKVKLSIIATLITKFLNKIYIEKLHFLHFFAQIPEMICK